MKWVAALAENWALFSPVIMLHGISAPLSKIATMFGESSIPEFTN